MIRYAYRGVSRNDFKQNFLIGYDTGNKSVLVGIGSKGMRIRYPQGVKSSIKYLKTASDDLKSLAALLIVELIPGGIFADKLQEEFPEHEEAANIIRDWFSYKVT